MRTFDLTGADRQSVGQGVMIVQVVPPTAQIAMASAHRRLIVVYFGSFDVAGERRQRLIETPGFERFLLRVHPGVKRRGVLRNRLGGGAYSGFRSYGSISCVFVIMGAFPLLEDVQERADGAVEGGDGACGKLAQVRLEFAVRQFDRVEVG